MLVLVLALVGGVLGFGLLGWHMGGFAAGAAIGALVGWSNELGDRVRRLEQRLSRVEKAGRQAAAQAPQPEEAAADETVAAPAPDTWPRDAAHPVSARAPRVPEPLPAAANQVHDVAA